MGEKTDILTLNIEETWNMFKVMEDPSYTPKPYKEARFGISLEFDINLYLKGRIRSKSKKGLTIIKGKAVSSEAFETELEERERIMKNWITANYVEDEYVKARRRK